MRRGREKQAETGRDLFDCSYVVTYIDNIGYVDKQKCAINFSRDVLNR